MIRNVLRHLNKAKYGPPPEKNKASTNADNNGKPQAQTATLVDFTTTEAEKESSICDEYFNIGDDILINKNFVVDSNNYCVNPFNKIKRVQYVALSPDQTIIHIYFEDYKRVPQVNWRKMVEALKNSAHERLFLLGVKIEEFKSSLREFERNLEEEYHESEPDEPLEVDEQKLVEQRLRQHTIPFLNSGGLYVKRDYVRRKGYYVRSVHVTKSLIEMVGWTLEDFIMECVLTKQHPECVMTSYYLENLVQTLECIKHSFLSKEYTSSKESISLLHKSSQIFEAKCEVVSIPKTGDFIMRIEIPETLSFSDDSNFLPKKKEKVKRFTASEKQFIEQFFSVVKQDSDSDDGEDQFDRVCKYRHIDPKSTSNQAKQQTSNQSESSVSETQSQKQSQQQQQQQIEEQTHHNLKNDIQQQ